MPCTSQIQMMNGRPAEREFCAAPYRAELPLPRALVQHATALRAALEQHAGGSWDVVVADDAWRLLPRDYDPDAPIYLPAPAELAQVLGEEFAGTVPQLVSLGDERLLAIVPAADETGKQCVVAGVVACRREELWLRMTTALVAACDGQARWEESSRQLDDFSRQVTIDFEELSFLRNLAEYIELCDLDHTMVQIAANVLPSLRELIAAEGIAILPLASGPESAAAGAAAPLYVTGKWNVSNDDGRWLTEHFGEQALHGPVVRNDTFHGCTGAIERGGPRSFILTHIGKGSNQIGWLLVANKLTSDPTLAVDARSCDSAEFGTNEAGMATAASVLLGNHAHNLAMFREQEELFRGVVKAQVDTIEAKDSYTRGHSDRVARMARRLAEELDFSRQECEQIYMAGLLHDIGKIGVRDEILLKPGRLTEEEFALVKKHPEIGYSILKHLNRLSYAFPGVLHHHESVDGSGYPHGLRGDQIPRCARVLAVVDAYDAMTSNRPYRTGMSTEQAEGILQKGAGQQWDSTVVAALFRIRADIYQICGLEMRAAVAP